MVYSVKFSYIVSDLNLNKTIVDINEGARATGGLKGRLTALSKTLQAYQSAVNEVAIVSITDLQGQIIYVNDKFIEISKYAKEELLGKTHRIINSGYHSADFFQQMWRTISTGKAWRGEIRNRAKDGSFYWVDTVITPVKDEDENIFQYLSIRNLITAQKESEAKLLDYHKALQEKARQLKDAQEVAKTGSWFLNIPDNTLEWSEETYRIFEIPYEQPMTYALFLERVHPDDRKNVEECWNRALVTGLYETEHRISTPSGEKWISERARLEFDPSASLNTALGTAQDITERKRTEQLLSESEMLYRGLFNASPFVIGLVDKATMCFLEVNKTATRHYGYSREEFLRMSVYDVRVAEEHESLKQTIEQGHYKDEVSVRKHRKKNGDIILIEPTITEVNYKNRKAYLITINDVTEKLKIQEERALEKYNRQVEIDRATLEAEERSRAAIGRELHDNINQLLVASTLFFKKTTAASEKDAGLLATGIEIIGKAIEEIRKLSSHFVPPSLNNLSLEESIEHLARKIQLAGTSIRFESHIIEEQLTESFKVNLYRIIQEQFNNIIKYAGPAAVSVKLNQHEKTLTLEITDNGRGFDMSLKPAGIGLLNIRHRAELYNGTAMVQSSPGNGCRVLISFQL